MDIEELEPKSKNENLNKFVAITVVLISITLAVFNIKDGNICQAMQLATASSVDTWNEYQAQKLKLHAAEDEIAQMKLQTYAKDKAQDVAAELQRQEAKVTKYTASSNALFKQAKAAEEEYSELGYRDDQFDISEAFFSIALALAAVAALTDLMWSIFVSWGFAGFGALMGIAGFAGIPFHPDAIASFLS